MQPGLCQCEAREVMCAAFGACPQAAGLRRCSIPHLPPFLWGGTKSGCGRACPDDTEEASSNGDTGSPGKQTARAPWAPVHLWTVAGRDNKFLHPHWGSPASFHKGFEGVGKKYIWESRNVKQQKEIKSELELN